jgi:hypothetical protein
MCFLTIFSPQIMTLFCIGLIHYVLKMCEICFESIGSPGLYIGSSAMLSSFSTGRTTSLVIDIGASGTRITPIVDGYELVSSTVATSRGGDALDALLYEEIQLQKHLHATMTVSAQSPHMPEISTYIGSTSYLHPWFDCKHKDKSLSTLLSDASFTAQVTASFRQMHVQDIVRDVKQWMCFVPHAPIVLPPDLLLLHNATSSVDRLAAPVSAFREEELRRRLLHFPPPYELPDGTCVHASDPICTAPERLFFPSRAAPGHVSSGSVADNGGGGTSGSDAKNGFEQASGRKRTRALLDSLSSEGSSNNNGSSSNNSNGVISNSSSRSLMSKLGQRVDYETLSDLAYAAVANCDADVRKDLLGNIQIVGSGALIQGVSNRLMHEISETVPTHLKV